MAHYVTRVRTPKSPEDAFDFMADLRNFEKWDPGVSSSEQVDGDGVGQGAKFDVTANATDLTYVLVEYDRPSRVVAEANTPRLRSYDIIEVEPDGEGAIVTYDATLELKGVFGLAEPLMKLLFRRIGRQADNGLQKALDGEKVG